MASEEQCINHTLGDRRCMLPVGHPLPCQFPPPAPTPGGEGTMLRGRVEHGEFGTVRITAPIRHRDGHEVTVQWADEPDGPHAPGYWVARCDGMTAGEVIGTGPSQGDALLDLVCAMAALTDMESAALAEAEPKLADAQARAERAEADTARLDWLERVVLVEDVKLTERDIQPGGEQFVVSVLTTEAEDGYGYSLRAAIDAARRTAAPGAGEVGT